MKIKLLFTFVLVYSLSYNTLFAQDQKLYEHKQFVNGKDTLNYRIMLPKKFDNTKKYPVLLFLHGAGERGNDNTIQLVHGSSLFAKRKNRKKFPAIVIFPQCPKDDFWANASVDRSTKPISLNFPLGGEPTKSLKLVMELMESYLNHAYVKKDQIYVGGLSMGGMGTFELLYRKPKMFAAAFSICGAGNPVATEAYAKKTELWVFHGAKDDIVNPQLSIDMVSGVLQAGGTPNFSLYANDNHNSWDSTFAEPELLPWLFSKSK
ncbi:alpha/beta hydrolase-fold protein [Geojedonia litorea]|uniref:Alpha/beta hydrolase-fold protein n=1 Tax=Geojedonia litorea TaxID=1268269 RepID=A0ABV9N699_9FLAO